MRHVRNELTFFTMALLLLPELWQWHILEHLQRIDLYDLALACKWLRLLVVTTVRKVLRAASPNYEYEERNKLYQALLPYAPLSCLLCTPVIRDQSLLSESSPSQAMDLDDWLVVLAWKGNVQHLGRWLSAMSMQAALDQANRARRLHIKRKKIIVALLHTNHVDLIKDEIYLPIVIDELISRLIAFDCPAMLQHVLRVSGKKLTSQHFIALAVDVSDEMTRTVLDAFVVDDPHHIHVVSEAVFDRLLRVLGDHPLGPVILPLLQVVVREQRRYVPLKTWDGPFLWDAARPKGKSKK